MTCDFDVIVVGSGPAGVSAAFPLVSAGLRVAIVDAGVDDDLNTPAVPFHTARMQDELQWKWMIGERFHALRNIGAVTPKFRVPAFEYVFRNFQEENRIHAENFFAFGSMARGGLSNAWGCGVARLSQAELMDFPVSGKDMSASYEAVSRRIGISGASCDDLSDYYGLDEWIDPPILMDERHVAILKKYHKNRSKLIDAGFRLGRTRTAALSIPRGERKACESLGNCLYGCAGASLYRAVYDLDALNRHSNFSYIGGVVVHELSKAAHWTVIGKYGADTRFITAKKLF